MKNLNDLKPGETGRISAWIWYESKMILRLAGLGLSIGKEVKVIRKGWFRPIHLQVGMTEIFIRKKDAQNIWVYV